MDIQLNPIIETYRNLLREIDIQFARFCFQLCGNHSMSVLALLVSEQLGRGNVCLDFRQPHPFLSSQQMNALFDQVKSVIGNYSDIPLVLEDSRVYMQRYHEYECFVATAIANRCQNSKSDHQYESQASLSTTLNDLFSHSHSGDDIDWQKVAVSVAAQSRFTIISGGPGTGKTTTVIKLLALLINQFEAKKRLPIIKLAAPTGKAAMRLTESIVQAKDRLKVEESIKDAIPVQAFTLHRLLKRNRQGEFFYHQMNPLHLDILVIDEASMIDLPMMAKLLAALPEHCQLIMLGDKDQLSSVEAGSVLADMCDSGRNHGYSEERLKQIADLTEFDFERLSQHVAEPTGAAIRDHICHLRKSHRFSEHSGIAALAKAANEADYSEWNRILESDYSDVDVMSFTEYNLHHLIEQSAQAFELYQQQISPSDNTDDNARSVLHLFNGYRILCAVKEGDLGVTGLNKAIEQRLHCFDSWYAGRPIIIQQNDYALNLYNGDVGIVMPRSIDGQTQLRVAFLTADNQIRWLQPARLPQHETVYAMTVHKSQGSEFEHCALVLPDYPAPVLTKELLYTGITRVKSRLTLLARDKLVAYTLRNQVQRASGLRDRLWQVEETVISPETGQISLF